MQLKSVLTQALGRLASGPWGASGAMLRVRGILSTGAGPEHPFALAYPTVQALCAALDAARAAGWEVVSQAEGERRAAAPAGGQFFVISFEHAWRDVLNEAAPMLKGRGAPFVLEASSELLAGRERAWEVELEAAIARLDYVEINVRSEMIEIPAGSPAEKRRAFQRLCADLALRPPEDARDVISRLVARAGLEPGFTVDEYASARELATWAEEPLCDARLAPQGDFLAQRAAATTLPVLTFAPGLAPARGATGPARALARSLTRARPPSSG